VAANRLADLVERTDVLNIPVHSVVEKDIAEIVDLLLAEECVCQIMLFRWWDFMRARADRELRQCARESKLSIPVSKSVVFGARFLRKQHPPRHLPFDFTIRLLGALEDKHRSVYILGGSPDNLRTVEQNLRETFPGLRFVGRYSGYYNKMVESDIITAIRKAGPDLIVLGGGIAAGQKWVSRHRKELAPCITLYSPETFEIFAEKRQRTSRVAFQRGLDFLPGFLRRPWRILRLPVFLWYLFLLLVFKVFRR
jgi:N-acetylglucosaminyldiphosphoundecaprenol N-acetyl-beta-D-mannosaminyltransferase